MRVALVGFGAVGRRAARQLLASEDVESLTIVHRQPGRVEAMIHRLGDRAHLRAGGPSDLPTEVDVVLFTAPAGLRVAVDAALDRHAHVVAVTDNPAEIRQSLTAGSEARTRGLSVILGAAFAPGLSDVLATFAAGRLDRVSEIHVASMGTGGPACAHRHHTALSSVSSDYVDGAWLRRPGGSGRELVWFPEPVGGADCYRADVVDPRLLAPVFPDARRITARLQATRRDRMTSWLPMLRPPHPEGTIGAVRVEVRGWVGEEATTLVMGAVGRPALAAGTVLAVAAEWAHAGRLDHPGAGGLAEMVSDPAAFLVDLRDRGLATWLFEGDSEHE